MALKGKMQAYAEGRAAGMDPNTAGAHAGYAPGAGMRVVASKLEARADVRAEIKRLKKAGVDTLPESGPAPAADESGKRTEWQMQDSYASPLELLEDIMNNPNAPKSLRYQAAKDALPYRHGRVAEAGKKEKKQEAAEVASAKGKFQRKAPPKRVSHSVN